MRKWVTFIVGGGSFVACTLFVVATAGPGYKVEAPAVAIVAIGVALWAFVVFSERDHYANDDLENQ